MMAQRRQLDMFTNGKIVGMLESSRSQTEVSRILNVGPSVISRLHVRGFKERETSPDSQYQVDQESQPLAKTDICLSSDSRRVTIWREHGTRFEPRNITERHHFPSRGVMVFAGITMDGRTDLHFFDTGSVTAQRYRDEVLEPYVRLFRGAVGPDFIFMDDNAPCHRAVLIDYFLEMENIQRMSWPANSPDLNPIKNVWICSGEKLQPFRTHLGPLQN
ncbi:transposable element Tcb2 transposase [Trichonephila clavipes]|nr:transposable element Tcb2 transposase [Trichonephila clavipes]